MQFLDDQADRQSARIADAIRTVQPFWKLIKIFMQIKFV